MSAVLSALENLAGQFGYLGVFVVSLLGSVIPFIPLPYLAVVVLLSGTQDPLLLGIAAGFGGAIGKVTSYALGRLGYLAASTTTQGNLDVLHKALSRYGALGVFIFSVTPLPDDVYVVPMGIIKLPFWRFFAANLAGKVVLSVAVAYLGRAYFTSFESFVGDSAVVIIVAIIATFGLTVAIARADWLLALQIGRDRGFRGVLSSLPEILRLKRRRN